MCLEGVEEQQHSAASVTLRSIPAAPANTCFLFSVNVKDQDLLEGTSAAVAALYHLRL